MATWRNGYAEDCKSFYPSSILGVASKKFKLFYLAKNKMATWRNGYAEDCKSLYPGSIPGVASKKNLVLVIKKSKFAFYIPR